MLVLRLIKCYNEKIIMKELKKSCNYFIKEVNADKYSKGCGLIRDKTLLTDHVASVAACRIWISSINNWSKT